LGPPSHPLLALFGARARASTRLRTMSFRRVLDPLPTTTRKMGSDFDDFLRDERLLDNAEAVAARHVIRLPDRTAAGSTAS